MSLPADWTDFDRALFMLDGACQSIAEDPRRTVWPEAMELLWEHRERREQLRREYAVWTRSRA